MDPALATIAAAAGLFAATNVDDMVVLAVLNASSQQPGGRRSGRSGPDSTPGSPS
jgi:cadmium resistance protein CadD (predicted permease)